MIFNYPLQIRFKLVSLSPRFSVTDSSGNEIMYIEQKLMALRESIKIFNNQTEKEQIYNIKTPQIIDFNAQYFFHKGSDESTLLGSIKQEGLKTITKATYNIFDKLNSLKFTVTETDPWIRLVDFLFSQIPILGWFSGYVFHPSYDVTSKETNQNVMTIAKEASFFERQFRIEIVDHNLNPEDEINCLLGLILMIQLQKGRA